MLVTNTDRMRRALEERKRAHAADEARLVTGATPALAASALQGLLQRYADESSVQLNRVDVVSEPRPGQPGLLAIPVQLQGQGDIYGLVDFLARLEHGETLLVLDDVSLNAAAVMSYGPRFPSNAGGRAPGSVPLPAERGAQRPSWSLPPPGPSPAGGQATRSSFSLAPHSF